MSDVLLALFITVLLGWLIAKLIYWGFWDGQ